MLGQRVHMTEQALATLEYEIELLPRNVEANLRHIWTIPLPAQDRAIALMKSPKLHTWLTSTHSSALFVNGNGDASARQSPLSFICSKLMDTVCPLAVGMRPKYCSILAQSFFCGQHVDIEDPAKGPVGMMRNLVSQILINYSAFSMPTIRRLLDIDPFDIRALCNIFSGLIKQLPRRYMVLFIIDGITFYEDSPTECEDATEAVQTLLEVMESCKRRGCMFKVLLTCPGNSRTLYREFDEDEEVIWLPTKVDPQGGLTPTKWEASAEPHVKEWLGDSSID